MAARLKDIAEALNVSIVTVSKVLNNDLSISKSTRQRVLDCARRLNYRTNLTAKGLVTGQSKMLGLIVPDLFHGFFSEVAAGMSDSLRQHGYGLVIASSRDDGKLEGQEIKQMLARTVDALIVATCELKTDLLNSVAREIPLILLDRRIASKTATRFVGTDDLQAGELATQHLIDIGRKRIAHLGGPDFSPATDRERAYRTVLRRAGINVSEKYVVRLPRNEESNHVLGAKFMHQLLKLKTRPDAVFCYNDPTAMGAMSTILDAGLRIPEDIAVLGCGNTFYNDHLRVPLTSIDQNASRLGHEAAKLAFGAIRDWAEKVEQAPAEVILKPTLVVRDSTVTGLAQRSREQT
jgi:LacI family transcriptional regulator